MTRERADRFDRESVRDAWDAAADSYAGFPLDRLLEPRPTVEAVHRHPSLAGARRMPFFLTLVATRRTP